MLTVEQGRVQPSHADSWRAIMRRGTARTFVHPQEQALLADQEGMKNAW